MADLSGRILSDYILREEKIGGGGSPPKEANADD
jgi:hypothetical protein